MTCSRLNRNWCAVLERASSANVSAVSEIVADDIFHRNTRMGIVLEQKFHGFDLNIHAVWEFSERAVPGLS